VTELENLLAVFMQPHDQAGFWTVMTRQMEQPATLPLRFPSSPADLRPSTLEWQPNNPSPLDKAFGNAPAPSASHEVVAKFPKTTTFKRPKRRKQPSLVDRQDSSPSSLHTLVAGSSALLGALAVSILTPGSFPTTTTKSLPRCPTNWRDATHVGLGCVWAATKGGGVNQTQAEEVCTGMGQDSRLVEVDNEEQRSFLESYLSKVETDRCESGNYQYDYYDYYSDGDYSSAFSSYGGCYYRSFHWWLGHQQVENKVLSVIAEKSGGYDEQACLQAFDAVTTGLAMFATRCSDHYNVFPVCQLPMEVLDKAASLEGFGEAEWPEPRNPGRKKVKPERGQNPVSSYQNSLDITNSKNKTQKKSKKKPTNVPKKKPKHKRKRVKNTSPKPPKKSKVQKRIEKIKREIKEMNRKKSKNKNRNRNERKIFDRMHRSDQESLN